MTDACHKYRYEMPGPAHSLFAEGTTYSSRAAHRLPRRYVRIAANCPAVETDYAEI